MRPSVESAEGLFHFAPGPFVEQTVAQLAAAVERRAHRGVVFGASGGIDSTVAAALCLLAAKEAGPWRVVGLQLTDRRIQTERYNPGIYQGLGAEIVRADITTEAVAVERRLGLPRRRLTVASLKLLLRWLPARLNRRLLAAALSPPPPRWARGPYRQLTLSHRLRIRRVRQYARRHQLGVVICANRSEARLGYFVERGVDDAHLGDYAPLLPLYKFQVVQTARFLGLPEAIIRQKPSPGFGGIYDEEILGPYELVDLFLLGQERGYSEAQLSRAIEERARNLQQSGRLKRLRSYDRSYVRFLGRLAQSTARKPQS